MSSTNIHRVKFYGTHDLSNGLQVERVVKVLEQFDERRKLTSISEAIELENVRLFIENGILPARYEEDVRETARKKGTKLRKPLGSFFGSISSSNIGQTFAGLDPIYRADLVSLIAFYKVYNRCDAEVMLPALDAAGVTLGDMLENKEFVRHYDLALRERIISSPRNAELLVSKHLVEHNSKIYLPLSFGADDALVLWDAYLESEHANPNYLEAISVARVNEEIGIDDKTKLKARRKHRLWTENFFKENPGIKAGCEVMVADNQEEPVVASIDGLQARISYSRDWLERTLDYPSILNNFVHLLGFADARMILQLPSYTAHLGVMERIIMTKGKKSYPSGAAFRLTEQTSFLNTMMYSNWLRQRDIEIQDVVAWFFSTYLSEEFGAQNLRFTPASAATTYLEKCRHIFAEMEGVVRQFSMYVRDGEIDSDLLSISSSSVEYLRIPSLVHGKYVYANAQNEDIWSVLHLLFSDQSGLVYVDSNLSDDDAALLIGKNDIPYARFDDYQKSMINYLVDQNVLAIRDERIVLANLSQVAVLRDLFEYEAGNYLLYPNSARTSIDEMIDKGWIVRGSSLLTPAEARYLNYCLNQRDYSNGPDLRNKYSHGSNVDASREDEHFSSYIIALKLLIALIVKMNDDFCQHQSGT